MKKKIAKVFDKYPELWISVWGIVSIAFIVAVPAFCAALGMK